MPGKKPRHKPGEPPIRTIDYTVNADGCWVWNWSVHRKGYASVWVDGRGVKAHRVAYELANGLIPEGMVIRHICPNGGNPSCVNPDHLRAGTPSENARDMAEAGNQGNQKLLPSDAAEIRRIFAAGNGKTSRRSIARQYGVSSGTISLIIANKTFYDPGYTPQLPQQRGGLSAKRLDESQAGQIRQLYSTGEISQRDVAAKFGIHPGCVSQIVRNLLYPDSSYTVPTRKAVNQKLTQAQADEIREKFRNGVSRSAIAKEYGVRQNTVHQIITGKTHTGIPRQYQSRANMESEPRPTLQSTKEPASTGKAMQAKRRRVRNSDIRPKHQPGQPFITENDWVLDPKTGCHKWRWGNKKYRQLIEYKGKRELAYRVSWELHNGPIPDGYQINHRCNNGRCVNPKHLYLGDQFANMQDTVHAGNHTIQKLTWEQVIEIRAKYEPGKSTHKSLALEYGGVHLSTIGDIVNNITFHDPGYTSKSPEVSVRRVLTDSDAATIRQQYCAEEVSMSDLAHDFGVSRNTIARIIHNENYQDTAYTPPTRDFIRSRRGIVVGEKISSARLDSGKGA